MEEEKPLNIVAAETINDDAAKLTNYFPEM